MLDSLNNQLEQANSLEEKARAHYQIGMYFEDSMQRYRAIDNFLLSYELYQELRDTTSMVKNCSVVSINYWFLRDYDEMLKYRLEALNLLTLGRNQVDIAEATNAVAFVYLELNLFKEAKEYLDKALQLSQDANNPRLSLHVETTMGQYYVVRKEYAKASEWQEKALESCRLLKDNKELVEVLISAATAKTYLNNWEQAKHHLEEARSLNAIDGTKEYDGFLMGEIGFLDYKLRKPDLGVAKIKYSLDVAYEINNSPLIQRATHALALIYSDQKKYEDAYNYLSESIIELRKNTELSQADAIAEMTARYDSEKKQREIDKLLQDKELEEERQSHKQELYETRIAEKQKIIYLSLGALFLMGFLIVVIIRNNKNKLRARAELAFKEKQIREQQAIAQGQDEERKRIAKELHDGIGGSLSMIKMKIDELNSSESNNDVGDLSEDVRRACREVRSISHNLMSVDVEGENLVEAICNFVDNLLLNTEIKVRYDLFPEKGINELDEMTKHNCYRIIQELTNNCVKHADASELSIGIILDDEGGVIRVEDNGKGFDPNTIERTGIGMKSIEQRIKAIGGELMIEAAPGKGSTFQIQFPTATSKSVL